MCSLLGVGSGAPAPPSLPSGGGYTAILSMRFLANTLHSPGEPRLYRRALENGRREEVAAPIGMEGSTALKVAWWRGSVAGQSQPSHDFVSLFLHLRGAGVRRGDGFPEHASPGSAILPGLAEVESWESQGVFEWVQFYISRRLFDEVAGERYERDLSDVLIERGSKARSPAVARLAWQARNELFAGPPSMLQLDAWAVLLADSWLRDRAECEPAPETATPHAAGTIRSRAVRRAMEFAEEHLDRNITLEEMSKAAEVSRFHLVRLFRELVGQTPAAFARTRRIERGKDLLRTSDLSIAEIALRCGFADQSHFTTSFVQSTGITPGAFRTEG